MSEVICVKCLKRWISVRPLSIFLKQIKCPNCGVGYVIETGEYLDDDMQEDAELSSFAPNKYQKKLNNRFKNTESCKILNFPKRKTQKVQ